MSARPMMVNCSGCRTPLKLPSGIRSIRCARCKAVTHIAAPPHIQAPPSGQLPHPYGKRRAVICGISYFNSRTVSALESCLTNAKCMRQLLINNLKFPPGSILMLTEEETHPLHISTAQNMRRAMHWLVKEGCTAGDSLIFYFNGHGSRQHDYINDDEIDRHDEGLCPMDTDTEEDIIDDEINATIVHPLPRGAKLHSIMDTCNSGTVMDLPFLCRMNRAGQYVWEDHRPKSGKWKGTAGGEAITISACDDHQFAKETTELLKNTSIGAMTFCFIQAIQRSGAQGITYGGILNSIDNTLRNPIYGGFEQDAQLTASEPFDIYAKTFTL